MSLETILSTIDAEIVRLQQARALLAGSNAKPADGPLVPKKRKRRMSAEVRERIAEAQRKRWAAQKSPTAKSA
jgi:hypothetical protein